MAKGMSLDTVLILHMIFGLPRSKRTNILNIAGSVAIPRRTDRI